MRRKLTYELRGRNILAECKRRGWQLKDLAERARIDPKTVTNVVVKGKRASVDTLRSIARVLDQDDDVLIASESTQITTPGHPPTRVTIKVLAEGVLLTPPNHSSIHNAIANISTALADAGLSISHFNTEITRTSDNDITRLIYLAFGKMNHGGPYWVYLAVKPSRKTDFLRSVHNGVLPVYEFSSDAGPIVSGYGEIIVSGEGRMPPIWVTRRVSQLCSLDTEDFIMEIHHITIEEAATRDDYNEKRLEP